jgi:hypothetical protein
MALRGEAAACASVREYTPERADRKVLAGGLLRMAVAGDELAAAAGTTLNVAPAVVIAAPENKAVVALIALPRRALRAPRDRPVSPVDQVYRDLDAGGSAFHVLLAVGAGRGHTSRLRGRLTASKGRSLGWPTAARFRLDRRSGHCSHERADSTNDRVQSHQRA